MEGAKLRRRNKATAGSHQRKGGGSCLAFCLQNDATDRRSSRATQGRGRLAFQAIGGPSSHLHGGHMPTEKQRAKYHVTAACFRFAGMLVWNITSSDSGSTAH